MADDKRKRAVNFTMKEQNLLFSIALKYKNVIENKQTNATANCEKQEAWSQIATEFNATSQDFNNRTVEQLKRCYENRRQNVRKKKAKVRQECLKTGGGPSLEKNDDPDDLLVLSTMDPLTVEGHINIFDADSVNSIKDSTVYPEENEIEFIFEVGENQKSEEGKQNNDNQSSHKDTGNERKIAEKYDWKKYHSADLKRPLNPALLRSNAVTSAVEEDKQADPEGAEVETENIGKRCENHAREGRALRRGGDRRGLDRRRPTATIVKALASSALAQKYNNLADKKEIIADHSIRKIEKERLYAEKEHELKIKSLELDIQIKKKKLEKM